MAQIDHGRRSRDESQEGVRSLDVTAIGVVLCGADGTLFDSEEHAFTAPLASVLRPITRVHDALDELSQKLRLAVVTSSASARLDACLATSGLHEFFPRDVRFSAESALPTPVGKPDPAIYRFAGEQLEVSGPRALAVEDSVAGVRSAVGAGFPTVGMLEFVTRDERSERTVELWEAGAVVVVSSWPALAGLLATRRRCRSTL
jgi:HAD superfamily hydrolase (TIGR01509 family)